MLFRSLKDWGGKITSDGDRWFQNGRIVDTSPVKKILENTRIMAGLLGRFLAKTAFSRGVKVNRWEIPLIEGCVILTGRCDIRGLSDLDKPRVFHIDEFCRFIQDPRERSSRLATPLWIDKSDPYTNVGSKWRGDLARFFGASEGYFKVSVRRNHIDGYRLLAAQAAGVSSGSLWMDELASPGRTAARYSRTGILSRRQVSTMERIAATRGPAFS